MTPPSDAPISAVSHPLTLAPDGQKAVPSLILHANGVIEINGSGDDAIDVLSKALCALVRGGYQNQERT